MPSVLHEYAVDRALDILGPGSSTRGFRRELRKWFRRSYEISGSFDGRCEKCGPTRCTEACVKQCVEIDMPLARPIPDAFKIHRNAPRVGRGPHRKQYFIIDVIEIEGSSTLRNKVGRWIDFGTWIEASDEAFLRLRLYNEHLVKIGEYTEDDLTFMGWTEIRMQRGIGRFAR